MNLERLTAQIPGVLYQLKMTPYRHLSFLYLSAGCQDVWGVEAEAVQQDAALLLHQIFPEDLPDFWATLQQSAQTETLWFWEGRMQPSDARHTVRWVQGQARPRRQANGDVIWDGLWVEVTEAKLRETQTAQLPQDDRLLVEQKVVQRAAEPQQTIVDRQPDPRDRALTEPNGSASDIELNSLFAAMTDAVFVMNREGYYVKIAPTNPSLLFKPSEELLGKTLSEVMPPDAAQQFLAFLRLVLDSETPQRLEYPLTIHDTVVWFEATGTQLNQDHVLLVARDISRRKQAETELALREQQLKTIATTMPGALFQFAVRQGEWTVDYISDGITAITGLTPDQIMVNMGAINDCQHPDDRDAYVQSIMTAIESLQPWHYEGRCIHQQTGAIHWWQGDSIPVRQDNGDLVFCGVLLDITSRKQAERALQEAKQELEQRVLERTAELQQQKTRLQEITNVVPGVIYQYVSHLHTGERGFTYLSSKARTLFELDDSIMLDGGDLIAPLLHPEDVERVATSIDQAVQNRANWFQEFRVITPSQQEKWIQAQAEVSGVTDTQIVHNGILLEITDRKRAEIELQQTQVFLTSVLENLPIAVVAKDATSLRWTLWNRAAEKVLGIPYQAVLGRKDEEICCQYPTDFFGVIDLESCPTQEVVDIPMMTITLVSGESRILHIQKLVITDADGDPESLLVILEDITDRLTADNALRYSEKRFRDVTEAAGEYIWEMTANGYYTFVSERVKDVKGYSPEELLGHTPFEFMPLEEVEPMLQIVQTAAAGKHPFKLEHRDLLPDGSIFWEAVSGLPMLDDAGEIIGFRGTGWSITEQKEAEQQLKLQAQREKLLNNLRDQIRSSLEAEVILTTAVEALRDFLQVERCSFIRYCTDNANPYWQIIKEVYDPKLPPVPIYYAVSHFPQISARLANLQVVQIDDLAGEADLEIQALYQIIQVRSLLLVPLKTRGGTLGSLNCSYSSACHCWTVDEVEFVRDVAIQVAIALDQAELLQQSRSKAEDLEQALHKLHQTQAQMVQSEKMSSLGQLVAGVAHEINNPVNFIYGNISHAQEYTSELLNLLDLYQRYYPNPATEIVDTIEALDLDFLREDLSKLLTSMKVGADRIQKIVLSLRNFSRMDEAEFKAVNIHEGLDNTLLILQNRLKSRANHPEIQVVKQYGQLPDVECYAGQLNQVFMNILTNAIDALEERDQLLIRQGNFCTVSRIQIITEQLDAFWIRIRLMDNGPGIPPEIKKRIFDPFFTTKPVGKGTGLGMSISYQIVVEKHRGRLFCDSEIDWGTTFTIDIPIRQQFT